MTRIENLKAIMDEMALDALYINHVPNIRYLSNFSGSSAIIILTKKTDYFITDFRLDNGFTVASTVNDAPIVFEDSELERTWKPENFSQKFYGPTRLREAMVNSRNLVSIRLLRSIGVDKAREYITNFGFELDELPANLTMALGSASLTPLSMARGFAVFANGGYLVTPQYIRRIG